MLWIKQPTAILTWEGQDWPPDDPHYYVSIPVVNMVPEPLAWLARFCAAACTPPTECYVLLPKPRKVDNADDPVPPPVEAPPPAG